MPIGLMANKVLRVSLSRRLLRRASLPALLESRQRTAQIQLSKMKNRMMCRRRRQSHLSQQPKRGDSSGQLRSAHRARRSWSQQQSAGALLAAGSLLGPLIATALNDEETTAGLSSGVVQLPGPVRASPAGELTGMALLAVATTAVGATAAQLSVAKEASTAVAPLAQGPAAH